MERLRTNAFCGGVGLRSLHYPYIESNLKTLKVDWFEAISENYMNSEGRPLEMLLKVRSHFDVALHGVSLSIASPDEPNKIYLKKLKELYDTVNPFLCSDHLCWTGTNAHNAHDLLPIPWTTSMVDYLVEKIDLVQNALQRQLILENVSCYFTYKQSLMQEWEFHKALYQKSGCKMLLDLNNIYVNSQNFHFDANKYVQQIPADMVGQIHLAGFTDTGKFLFDTHSKPVFHEVWKLYENFAEKFKNVPVLLEWDEDIPPFGILEAEIAKAKIIWEKKNEAPLSATL